MGRIQRMSDSEKEIMRVVWSSDGPVSFAQIQDSLRDKAWKRTTVLTFLVRLVEKGMIASVKSGRGSVYAPLVSQTEYKRFETRSFLDSVHDGSIKSFITALYSADDLTGEDIKELQAWFSGKRVET